MKTTRACPYCGRSGIWVVRSVHERDPAYAELGAIDEIQPLETYICDRCGYTAWYSGAIDRLHEEGGRVAKIDDERLACSECTARRHFLVAEVQEWPANDPGFVSPQPLFVVQTGRHGGNGRFALLICGGCGRCHWYAWGGAVGAEPRAEEACPRCSTMGRSAVRPLRENGGTPLPVAVAGQRRPIGQFDVSFCLACGYCDWYARAIEDLQLDGEHVRHLVDDDRRASIPGGPYR